MLYYNSEIWHIPSLTPDQILKYKTAILFHKTYSDNTMSFKWQQLFFNQNFNQRNNMANFLDTSTYKVGKK